MRRREKEGRERFTILSRPSRHRHVGSLELLEAALQTVHAGTGRDPAVLGRQGIDPHRHWSSEALQGVACPSTNSVKDVLLLGSFADQSGGWRGREVGVRPAHCEPAGMSLQFDGNSVRERHKHLKGRAYYEFPYTALILKKGCVYTHCRQMESNGVLG